LDMPFTCRIHGQQPSLFMTRYLCNIKWSAVYICTCTYNVIFINISYLSEIISFNNNVINVCRYA
jgi:hypothetical protein